jgi:uncharacterized protein (TIGR03437 family)
MKLFTPSTKALRVADRKFKRGIGGHTLLPLLLGALLTSVFVPPNLFAQPAPVNLGSAGNYVILSKTGVTDVPASHITGNVASSPVAGAAIGITCAEVSGTISSVDATGPAPCSLVVPVALTQAITDMQTAYTAAAGLTTPNYTELGAGNISGMTLAPGLYKWSTDVLSDNTGFTLSGGPNSVWIFQIAGNLTIANGAHVILSPGVQAGNVFWQVGGATGITLGTTSSFFGNLLSAKQVILNTGATLVGRALAQTQVTLQSNTITSPGSLVNGVPPLMLSCSVSVQPSISVGGILNSASWTPTVAAGSIASAFGNNFGSALTASTYPLLTALWFTSFKAGTQFAPLFMTSCNQVNMQIPWEDAGLTQVPITANVGGLISPPQMATLAPFAPGIFTMNQSGSGQGAVEIASTGQLAAFPGTNSRPVTQGEYVVIYCTGLGAVSNQPATGSAAMASPLSFTLTTPTVTIGGVSARVTFSGLTPGFAGLYQVNALVPAGVAPGATTNLILSIGGFPANTVTIATQ